MRTVIVVATVPVWFPLGMIAVAVISLVAGFMVYCHFVLKAMHILLRDD